MLARLRSSMRWKLAVAGGSVLIAALVLVTSFSTGLVGAQSSSGTPTAGSSTTPTTTTQYPAIVTALAKQLGIDPAKVEAALEQVIGQQALNGNFGRGGIFGGFLGPRGPIGPGLRRRIERGGAASIALGGALKTELNNLATFFGESPSALTSELGQGMTLAQIAQKHGKTTDELKTFLTQQFQSSLDSIINHSFTGKRTTPATPATPSAATPSM